MITVLNTVAQTFRGNYKDVEAALKSVRSLRDNFYLLDDVSYLIDFESFSLSELQKYLIQFDNNPPEQIRTNRRLLVNTLGQYWENWGLRPYRKGVHKIENKY